MCCMLILFTENECVGVQNICVCVCVSRLMNNSDGSGVTPQNNLWLFVCVCVCVCVCVHIAEFTHFTHWFHVCVCVNAACVCFLQASAMENRKLSLSLSSPPPLSATSFARSHTRSLAAPLKRGGCVFLCSPLSLSLSLALSSCLLLSNSPPTEGQTAAHLLARRKVVHVHARKHEKKDDEGVKAARKV